MFGIRFVKFHPTTYAIHYRNGRIVREGAGLSFLYYAPTSSLVAVPLASTDLPFVFPEMTADFQEVTVQGQLTYRVTEPVLLSQLLDFSLDHRGNCRGEGAEEVQRRLVKLVQVQTRASLQRLDLRGALVSVEQITREVLGGLRETPMVVSMGIEVMGLTLSSVRATPEMARALEAEAREELNRRSDEAIYRRRNSAVEQERRIKESELDTELAVEARKREIREAQLAAEIAVEEQRAALIAQRVENEKQEAQSRAYALETILAPVRDVGWQTLLAMGAGGADPRMMIAGAFQQMAENASKIGEINVSPELLTALLDKRK
ncbi:MAG: SPFH domain-containing protein [Armatimonadetes bacterium]|nr:SPFH domain-containing protein [Armatimonadota bacterium]